jgi:hypothetical protein
MNFINTTDSTKKAATCYYIVVEIDGVWWIDVEGKPCGPCEDKDDAIACAFKLVELFGDPSRPAAIYAPADDGHTMLIWRGRVS